MLERAALYERPVIATRVGGLAEQAADRLVTFVDDDVELAAAMRTAAGLTGAPEELAWDLSGDDLFERVQSEVRARARKARGGDVPFTGHAPVVPAADVRNGRRGEHRSGGPGRPPAAGLLPADRRRPCDRVSPT